MCVGERLHVDVAVLSDAELLELRAAMGARRSAFELGDPRATPEAQRRPQASLVYLVDPGVRLDASIDIQRSDAPLPAWLRAANPGNWEAIEWDELLDGRLGPWAIASVDRRVVSLCHTPIPMTEAAAEAGVWTDPEHCGRGYAAATTAAWAATLRGSGRRLFYTTSLANRSSQRVADRLGARLLGWTWPLGEPTDELEDGVHPLSSLSARSKA